MDVLQDLSYLDNHADRFIVDNVPLSKLNKNKDDSYQTEHRWKSIVKYIYSSYFGETDIFAEINGLSLTGRDSTAICHQDSLLLLMSVKSLNYIK